MGAMGAPIPLPAALLPFIWGAGLAPGRLPVLLLFMFVKLPVEINRCDIHDQRTVYPPKSANGSLGFAEARFPPNSMELPFRGMLLVPALSKFEVFRLDELPVLGKFCALQLPIRSV